MEFIKDIDRENTSSGYLTGSFDECKFELESKGYKILSLEQNVRLRMFAGKKAYISRNGNWTREAILYLPNKGNFLVRESPAIKNSRKATESHRKIQEMELTEFQINEALKNSIKLPNKSFEIAIEEFDKKSEYKKILEFMFGYYIKEYKEFLIKSKIKKISFFLDNIRDKPFFRQVWFSGNISKFRIFGDYLGLDLPLWVRGIKEK